MIGSTRPRGSIHRTQGSCQRVGTSFLPSFPDCCPSTPSGQPSASPPFPPVPLSALLLFSLSVASSPLSSLMGQQSARVEPVSHAIHTLPSWAGSGHQPVLLSAFASVSVFIFQCVGGRAPRENWVSREDATKNVVAFLKS